VKHLSDIWSGHMNPSYTNTHSLPSLRRARTQSRSAPDVFACAIIPAKTLAQIYLYLNVGVCVCVCTRSCWSCKCLPFELLADLLALRFFMFSLSQCFHLHCQVNCSLSIPFSVFRHNSLTQPQSQCLIITSYFILVFCWERLPFFPPSIYFPAVIMVQVKKINKD